MVDPLKAKEEPIYSGQTGEADVLIVAESAIWLGFLAKERSLIWALLRGKIRVKGSLRLLAAFGKCFPN